LRAIKKKKDFSPRQFLLGK